MRLLFRSLSLVLLSIAVISAVVDIARSLAASTLVLTSLMNGWNTIAPSSLAFTKTFFSENLPAFMSDTVLTFLLNMPAAAVFAVLAAFLYTLGARREQPFKQIRLQ